ncbi:L-cysteine/cystine lyase [Ruegeria halocynthiae]|uniref:L-cysteine/cystine lyase n=1 Tax=Ruegeria halocynthiae TaxID=985054 RepID=A0A1H2ZMM9_9RHOB|nr:aminotransferase class V-fold PLP-dependent enzyme [Ruegeria halocynthiae]SDX18782.1 L-cysteine/cystine lyase [Ruegeria halocynthiae]
MSISNSFRLGSPDIFPPCERHVYLDAASVGLSHKGGAEAISNWQNALAEEGTIAFDEQAEVECLDNLNDATARLFNATTDDIAVASSETTLMQSLAWAVMPGKGTKVVTTDTTHPSSIYPWKRLCDHTGAEISWARSDATMTIDTDALEAMIDDDTSVVVLSHVEWGTGQLFDLKRFADKAHKHGAILVIDATQSAGQVPIDVAATGADAVATSTYKWLCGPFGTGMMYVSPELQKLNPGILGWRSHKDMWDFQANRLELADNAKRYEFGTMAYGTAYGATESVRHLLDTGFDKIVAHNRKVSNHLIDGLRELGADVLGPKDEADRSATVAARFPGKNSRDFAKTLKDANVIASLRRDFIRFSPHYYNNIDDIDQGLEAIKAAL